VRLDCSKRPPPCELQASERCSRLLRYSPVVLQRNQWRAESFRYRITLSDHLSTHTAREIIKKALPLAHQAPVKTYSLINDPHDAGAQLGAKQISLMGHISTWDAPGAASTFHILQRCRWSLSCPKTNQIVGPQLLAKVVLTLLL
jgi:hypothetical protein